MRNTLLPALAALVACASFARAKQPHPLLGGSEDVVLTDVGSLRSSAPAAVTSSVRTLLASARASETLGPLAIDYPLEGAVFPQDFAAPTFRWRDTVPEADTWLIEIAPGDGSKAIHVLASGKASHPGGKSDPKYTSEEAAAYRPPPKKGSARSWTPRAEVWTAIKKASAERFATVTILGFVAATPGRALSGGAVRVMTSWDSVGAPIFYREVPLPFLYAVKNPEAIHWRLGDVASPEPPPSLLTNMNVCGNCHSFTPDGRTLAMDVDYGNDKGSYVITPINRETVLDRSKIISWSDYRREDNEPTFGLLSQISPDGRYVISTVKDRSVFSPLPEFFYSQRFFPIKGILVLYDRQAKTFFSLPGADDPAYVQSNPAWSPDGKTLVFARSGAHELKKLKDRSAALIRREEAQEFFEGGKRFRYDLVRIPFNAGKGGRAEPVRGASGNGKSNYFPRFSPDGKWIVFCQADSFMLLQRDSTLLIMPAEGGEVRRMRCNFTGGMNSWHSFSPNGRWMVFSSKVNGPFTQLWLTHIDEGGNDTPPVLLERFTAPARAANIPEFVNRSPETFVKMHEAFADYYTHYLAGLRQVRLFEHGNGARAFREAVRLKPDHGPSRYWFGVCLAATGRDNEAIAHLRKGLELEPTGTRAHHVLGMVLCRNGVYEEGLAHLEHALAGHPEGLGAANNLAWVLATCPEAKFRDGRRAVELAERACEATGHNKASFLDSLAAAYAETGDFADAVRVASRALDLARRTSLASVEAIEARLRLYKAGRAYRQGAASP